MESGKIETQIEKRKRYCPHYRKMYFTMRGYAVMATVTAIIFIVAYFLKP